MSESQIYRCLCVTDIHGDQRRFESILSAASNADAILLGGDLTNFGKPPLAETLVKLAKEKCEFVVAVAGNCDSPEIDERLVEMGVSVFGRSQTLGAIGVYGVSAMPPWQGTMYELTEEEIERSLETGWNDLKNRAREEPGRAEIVLSHPPPIDTNVDRTGAGQHVGSRSVRGWVERTNPDLVVCGHIHEARGIDAIGSTTVVNCGPAFLGHFAEVSVCPGREPVVEVELRTAK